MTRTSHEIQLLGQAIAQQYALPDPNVLDGVGPEVVPVLLAGGVGLDIPCWGAKALSASAGNYQHAQVFNPSGSGRLVYLESAWVKLGTAGDLGVRTATAALSTAGGSKGFRDTRVSGGPAGLIYHQAAAALQGTAAVHFGLGTSVEEIPLEYALKEGTGLILANTTLNDAVDITFIWSERAYRERTTG